MRTTGRLVDVAKSFINGKMRLTFEIDDKVNIEELGSDANHQSELDITAKPHRKNRSSNSNKYMWTCLQIIADAKGTDKWTEYLDALRHYGQGTYILVKNDPEVIAKTQAMWRESMVYGQPFMYGNKEVVNMLCFYGSSTYNTQEMSTLLNGIVNDMQVMGLPVPPTADLNAALEEWGRLHG